MKKKYVAILATSTLALIGVGAMCLNQTATASTPAPSSHTHSLNMEFCEIHMKDNVEECKMLVKSALSKGITTTEAAAVQWQKDADTLENYYDIMTG